MGTLLEWLLAGHTDFGVADYAVATLFAFLGAATCAFAINPKVQLPSIGEDEVDLGVLRVFLIGTVSGVAVGYHPPTPFLVGLVTPIFLPVLLNKTLPTLVATLQPLLIGFLETIVNSKKGGDKE